MLCDLSGVDYGEDKIFNRQWFGTGFRYTSGNLERCIRRLTYQAAKTRLHRRCYGRSTYTMAILLYQLSSFL